MEEDRMAHYSLCSAIMMKEQHDRGIASSLGFVQDSYSATRRAPTTARKGTSRIAKHVIGIFQAGQDAR